MPVTSHPLVIASNAADAAAADELVTRHAEMSGALETHIQNVLAA